MTTKIDTKEKIKYLRNYLLELRLSTETQPFLTLAQNECGFYDFDYVTRNRITLDDIEKNLKDFKYDTVKDMCEDIKIIYLAIADYLFLDDPLQNEIQRQIKILNDFENKFCDDFRGNGLTRPDMKTHARKDEVGKTKEKEDNAKDNAKEKEKEKADQLIYEFNRKSTFAERLEMFFYLRSHEDNAEYVKSIGDGYGIGSEEQNGEYLIKLEANSSTCPWAELLQKKDQ